MVAPGGACVVVPGGCAWLLRGACVVALGCVWLLWGACLVALGGGMHGCSGGACVVALGGHARDAMRYGDTINEWAVRILLECILVCSLQRYYYISAYLGIEEKVKFRIAFMTQKDLPCQLIFGHLPHFEVEFKEPKYFLRNAFGFDLRSFDTVLMLGCRKQTQNKFLS